MPIQPPSVGRTVHYVLGEDSPRKGEHRAAIITGVPDLVNFRVNLFLFFDQQTDVKDARTMHLLARGVDIGYDDEARPNTWHWQENVDPIEVAPTAQQSIEPPPVIQGDPNAEKQPPENPPAGDNPPPQEPPK